MPYTTNPYLPKMRAKACKMVPREGKSIRAVARYYGVNASTVSRWMKRYPEAGTREIRTIPSRPKSHPKAIDQKIVKRIVEIRRKRGSLDRFTRRFSTDGYHPSDAEWKEKDLHLYTDRSS